MTFFHLQRFTTLVPVVTVRIAKRLVHTISTVEYRIRSMKERDLPKVNALLDTEKWIMEKAYLDCAFKTDPRGFVVAESKNEEIIGFIGTLSLSKTLKAFGLWVVREDLRSTDVGSRLLEEINICPATKIEGFHFPHMQRTFELFTGPMTQSYTTWYNYGKIDKKIIHGKSANIPFEGIRKYSSTSIRFDIRRDTV